MSVYAEISNINLSMMKEFFQLNLSQTSDNTDFQKKRKLSSLRTI